MKERLLSHGLIIDSGARFVADLVISHGIITQLNVPGISSFKNNLTDFTGKYIIPGPILISRPSYLNTKSKLERFYPVATSMVTLIPNIESINSEPSSNTDCFPVPILDLSQIDDQILTKLVFRNGHNMFVLNHLYLGTTTLEEFRTIFQRLGEYGITLILLNYEKSYLDYLLSALSGSACRLLLVPNKERLQENLLCARRSKLLGHPVYVACPSEALLSGLFSMTLTGLDFSADVFQIISVDNKLLKESYKELIAVLWAEMVCSGKIILEDFVNLLSIKPARFLGLTSKGTLRPGYEADLLVIDPEKNSNWFGEIKRGAISLMLRAGRELYENKGNWIRGSLPPRVI